MAESVISVRGLRKDYDGFEAVRGIDLEVERGEVFAFLGPNGAGKTTTVEILEGYRERSAGEVSVLGIDPADADNDWRQRVGIVLQQCRMPPELTVRETIELYAGYYEAPRSVDETIALVGLESKAGARAGKLSGGQERRLDVALALIGDPELLFLDEPTTGFDPIARRRAWRVIEGLRELDKTVFLTTHYMEEAQALAERVAIIAEGEIVAAGSPGEIGGRDRTDARVTFRLPDDVEASDLPVPSSTSTEGSVSVTTEDPVTLLNKLTGWALERGVELAELEVRRPSLEDVYIAIASDGESDPDVAKADYVPANGVDAADAVAAAGGIAPADRVPEADRSSSE
jgi:ABC-2 type transport system ATP-binding protein